LTRLLPRSLFGRLVLVLLGGLAIAQLISFAIHSDERLALLQRAGGVQSAQRIADTVRLLDAADAAGRQRIVNVLSAPPLLVSLDRERFTARAGEDTGNGRGAAFEALLRELLGDGWPIETVIAGAGGGDSLLPRRGPGAGGWGAMHGPMGGRYGGAMHGQGRGGFSFLAQVRLRDGQLVTFDALQAEPVAGWSTRVLLSLAVLLVAVVALSLLAVRWATRPLQTLADAADALGRNIDSPPMEEGGPIEVARAARAFNTMQLRLAANLRERTAVLAAMSHDLKTPVTRLRLRAELLADPELRLKFTRDLEEMEAMVAATLDFLRGTAGSEAVQPVDMGALLESLQADLTETGGEVTLAGRAPRPYAGQPVALKRCLRNLLENAVKYGNAAAVEIADNQDRLQIVVRDRGPGIPPAELERVFEPFYRLEGSRSRDTGGTGLGLTIARSIAQAHGGQLVLENLAGGGLAARLTLPRVPAFAPPTTGARHV
jgi:signal transduction histidine kinase